MKFVLPIVLLIMSTSSVIAFPSLDESAREPTAAFACKDCDLNAAKNIAIQNAPKNTCSIYQNSQNSTFCESITQTILVPVHNTENVFKFDVTTSIDSRNRPRVSVTSLMPLSTIESALMTKYIDFYKDFASAVNSASITSAELSPIPAYSLSNSAPYSSSGSNDCSSHPVSYFKGLNEKRDIRTELASRVTASIGGVTAVQYENEALVNSASVDVHVTGGGVSIGLQYVKNDLVITRGTSFENRLAFTANVYSDSTRGRTLFSLSLNPALTKIDGFKYSEIFGGGNIDMSDVAVTDCLREFLQDGEPVSPSTLPGGGDGTFDDPFVGPDIPDGGRLDWCGYRTSIRTCIEQPDGGQICTVSTYSFIAPCGRLN
ncbi:hypothetical protein [Brumicola pallidula]|jgi:hypothetical protein|uniref:Uncharacterized protein n=1 Tax=Brumicola pallidula DSM 14239 = ACAM 615 TaxID=1121922 RepID=K6Y3Q6_9ALTE|nr:hypothetical protein [Glaciecola pallidula]GAC27434.1 hypothetical protein GPAL_0554 [Glaciecola pallidula DSM 14239 = ACAM 615]